MPGVGKSYFGKKAAEILKMNFYDTDILIENNCKMSISRIFETQNEDFFRKKESEIIKKIVKQCSSNTIIATGGGTACNNNLMDFMNANGITIWLNADTDLIVKRLKIYKNKRPLLKNEVSIEEKIEKLYNERCDFYAQSKAKVIINEGLTPILFTNSLLLSTIE